MLVRGDLIQLLDREPRLVPSTKQQRSAQAFLRIPIRVDRAALQLLDGLAARNMLRSRGRTLGGPLRSAEGTGPCKQRLCSGVSRFRP
jgi:hypothetical protein